MFSKKLFFALAIPACLMASSCSKSDDTAASNNTDVAYAQDDTEASSMYDEVSSQQDEDFTSLEAANFNTTGVLKAASTNGSRTIVVDKTDSVTFPKTITITFNNWVGSRGHIKNGKIITVISNKRRLAGSIMTTTFDNLTIDSLKNEGTYTTTNLGNYGWNHTLVGGKITDKNGLVFTHEFTRTRTKVEGFDTKMVADDVFLIEGNGKGTSRNGVEYTSTIITPLNVSTICPWIRAGVIKITRTGKTDTIINYGDQVNCDNQAVVTVGDKTKTITLHRGKAASKL